MPINYAKSDHLMHIVLNPNGEALSQFEISKQFDDVVKAIARNRKFLLTQFGELSQRNVTINYKITKQILSN